MLNGEHLQIMQKSKEPLRRDKTQIINEYYSQELFFSQAYKLQGYYGMNVTETLCIFIIIM